MVFFCTSSVCLRRQKTGYNIKNMKKILNILPDSIGGALVIRGFGEGFKANSCHVLQKDLRELKIEDVKQYKPDIIFSYDYGFMRSEDDELKKYIIEHKNEYKLVHYFADKPDGKLAYVNSPELYEEFKKLNAVSFVWDKDFVNELPGAKYLPLAVNTKAYKIDAVDKKYDITFVGRPLSEKRQEVLSALIKTFGKKMNIFSYERHFLQSLDDMKDTMLLDEEEMEIYKNAYRGFADDEKKLAAVYQSSKIVVNITIQGNSSLNYSVFAVPASFGFLITNYVEDLKENFEIAKDLESYTDISDLIDKIKFYLKNPDIAERIALNGFVKVSKKHSYTARANTLLETIKEL